MNFESLKNLIAKKNPEAILGEDLDSRPNALIVDRKSIKSTCKFLRDHSETYFDSLSCLTGIDNGIESSTLEVVYNLYSIPYDLHLMLKVMLDREDPRIDTVSSVWKTANWHEREAYDMFGIKFIGHPDLRRILLPEDWVGHPLKKDYKEQEEYHGIKVKY